MTPQDTQFQTWEFKGLEIKPLSYARRFHLSKLVDFSAITPWDIAVLMFALSCDQRQLIRGMRDRDKFDAEVSDWIESNRLQMSDFDDAALQTIREVMENADTNRAIPVTDPNMMPDPLGNA